MLARRAATALERLNEEGIPAIAFKGIGVIANLYGGAGRRMVSDIDVLIDYENLERACGVLADLGFKPLVDRLEDYLEYLAQRPYEGTFSGHYFLVLADQDRVEIDLHWQLGTGPTPFLGTRHVIERAETVRLYGASIRVASPVDAIILIAQHVLRDNFTPNTTVKDLCDLAAWWNVQSERWSVDDVVAQARDSRLVVPLLALWRILVAYNPASPALRGTRQCATMLGRREASDARRLAEFFQSNVEERCFNEDLLRLLSPSVVKRFVARRMRKRAEVEYFTHRLERELQLQPHQSYSQRVSQLLRDLVRLNRPAIAAYKALLRAHGASRASTRAR